MCATVRVEDCCAPHDRREEAWLPHPILGPAHSSLGVVERHVVCTAATAVCRLNIDALLPLVAAEHTEARKRGQMPHGQHRPMAPQQMMTEEVATSGVCARVP